jgi:hypothetical protein
MNKQLWRCSRSLCGWLGTDDQKTVRKDGDKCFTYVCPACGCDSFYKAKPGEKPKTNLVAQEKVVGALWEFAAENKLELVHSTSCSDGTKCHLPAVGNALKRIMEAFGCAVVKVE